MGCIQADVKQAGLRGKDMVVFSRRVFDLIWHLFLNIEVYLCIPWSFSHYH